MMGIKSKLILITCMSTLLVGCSSVLSHTQSGQEENIYAKRSLGTAIDDNAIVGRIESKLRTENEQFASMIQVDSYNRVVLLTGRVPDQSFIDKAVEIASQTPGVRQVHLEISKGQATTMSNYWYDAWLTTKVKSQLTLTSNAPSNKTKVRSFAGYIYLMGVMTPQEAKNAIYVASRIPGAKKVISLIETVDNNGRALVSEPPKKKSSTRRVSDEGFQQEPDFNYTPPQEVDYIPPVEMDQPDSGSNDMGQGFYTEEPQSINNNQGMMSEPMMEDPSMNNQTNGYENQNSYDTQNNSSNFEFQNDYQDQNVQPQEVQGY